MRIRIASRQPVSFLINRKNIMGISKERVRQIVCKYQRKCKYEAQKQIPSEYEVAVLLPHIDSIKAIYENDS